MVICTIPLSSVDHGCGAWLRGVSDTVCERVPSAWVGTNAPPEVCNTNVAAQGPGIVIPPEIRKYFRENANSTRNRTVGGVHQRLQRQQLHHIPLPSFIHAKVQLLRNKIDKLQARVQTLLDHVLRWNLALRPQLWSLNKLKVFSQPWCLDCDYLKTRHCL